MVDLKLTLSSSILRSGRADLTEESHDSAARAKRKETEVACVGCGGRCVAFKRRAGAIVTAGNEVQGKEKQVLTTQNKFYCNIKALNPAECIRHKELTDKLIAAWKEVVETEKGYEFQYSPSNVSLAELADWVEAEGKCCRFFDFHIDLEREGTLLCLRLTGEEGIKLFIRSEFQVPGK
jgi:hypothetical protein